MTRVVDPDSLPADYPVFRTEGYARLDVARGLAPYSPSTVLMLHEGFYYAVSPWRDDPEMTDGEIARDFLEHVSGVVLGTNAHYW